MTSYFRVSGSPNDLLLLPPGIRTHAELPNVAARAEALVISAYSNDPNYFLYTSQLGLQGFFDASFGVGEDVTAGQPTSPFPNFSAPATAVVPQVRVFLRGYKVNASDPAADPNLSQALRFAISDVIRWAMQWWTTFDPGVESETTAGVDGGVTKSKAFRPEAEHLLPMEWQHWLDPYDSRPVIWGY